MKIDTTVFPISKSYPASNTYTIQYLELSHGLFAQKMGFFIFGFLLLPQISYLLHLNVIAVLMMSAICLWLTVPRCYALVMQYHPLLNRASNIKGERTVLIDREKLEIQSGGVTTSFPLKTKLSYASDTNGLLLRQEKQILVYIPRQPFSDKEWEALVGLMKESATEITKSYLKLFLLFIVGFFCSLFFWASLIL